MALDTLVINELSKELSKKLTDSRVVKVYQPERDEVMLSLRTYEENFKLVISASAAYPRIHFTEFQKENPMSPPMFCMLMRKHLTSGKIIKISQIDYERIIRLDIESYNELGDLTVKYLIVELMGRNSNIILTDSDMRIIDSARHVDFTQSSVRCILPGSAYVPPPIQEKIPVLSPDIKDVYIGFKNQGISPEKAIMEAVSGISPLTARELVYEATGTCSLVCGELTEVQKDRILSLVKEEYTAKPCILVNKADGRIMDFSAIDINQYGDSIEKIYYSSISKLLEDFYRKRDSAERMKQKSADLVKLLKNHEERLAKKSIIQEKTLRDAKKKDEYRIKGDLITANIYRVNAGDSEAVLENYYDEACPSIKITLKPELTPSQNAQRYYKLYNKAKNAETEVQIQIQNTRADMEYIQSTLSLVANAQSESDLNAIRTELAEQGFLKRIYSAKKKKQETQKPLHFVSSDGFDIYVGKNNTQNDYLTLKFANQQDLWFHTKQIHGSHTIIKLKENKDVPDTTLVEAAEIAAYYSQGRESSKVPVDYTTIKNVKKPNGAKPGMVIYDYYSTLYVNPKCPEGENK